MITIESTSARDLILATSPESVAMVHADPPWEYRCGTSLRGAAQDHYDGMTILEIAADIEAAYSVAAKSAYLFVWCTFPKLSEWMGAHQSLPWEYLSGGAWGKRVTGNWGAGFHFRGDAEVLLLYRKGNPKPLAGARSNLWLSEREGHSKKPDVALHHFVEMGSRPGDTVLDLYAGEFGGLARTCRRLGRSYRGAELDAERAGRARDSLRQCSLLGPSPVALPPIPPMKP